MKLILPDRSTRILDQAPATIDSLLRDLGFDPDGVMVSRNGTIVPEDALVGNDDEVRIIRIAHGG